VTKYLQIVRLSTKQVSRKKTVIRESVIIRILVYRVYRIRDTVIRESLFQTTNIAREHLLDIHLSCFQLVGL